MKGCLERPAEFSVTLQIVLATKAGYSVGNKQNKKQMSLALNVLNLGFQGVCKEMMGCS